MLSLIRTWNAAIRRRKGWWWAAIGAVYLLPLLPLTGLGAIYLRFETEIKGDVTTSNYDNWIEINSGEMGASRSISLPGGGKDREVSIPSISEVTLTKDQDISSADLFFQAIQGKSLGKAEIAWVNSSAQEYFRLTLHEAIVSSFSTSSAGGTPSESFSINFTKIEFTHTPWINDKKGTSVTKRWDLSTNKSF